MPKPYSHIFWDWNGTLFDDVGWCVKVMNQMLARRNLKTLKNVSEYHKVFCFPVVHYYMNIGFDFEKEPFEKLAHEYIALYHAEKTGNCKLADKAELILKTIQERHISQVILSASEAKNLASQVGEFNILSYFDEILGLSDIYAQSKGEAGLAYLARKKVDQALLVGDTEHDFQVANALGMDCVLIANGHQSREKLLSCQAPVLDTVSQVVSYIFDEPNNGYRD